MDGKREEERGTDFIQSDALNDHMQENEDPCSTNPTTEISLRKFFLLSLSLVPSSAMDQAWIGLSVMLTKAIGHVQKI